MLLNVKIKAVFKKENNTEQFLKEETDKRREEIEKKNVNIYFK